MNTEKEKVDGREVNPDGGTYQSIPVNELERFYDHAFEDYKGEQFDLLVESIVSNGLIHPIVVRPHPTKKGRYEILSGHNRVAAVKKLGWTEIPAVIRNMTDDDAIIFANEANVTQRRFESWLPSEKSKSIHQYHAGIKKQGHRSGREAGTSGENNQKFDARKETARVYRISENTVRLYLDLYRLIEPLMKRLDREEFGTTPAQALSCVPLEIQEIVNIVIEEDRDTCEITVTTTRKVRDEYKSYEGKDTDEITKIKDDIRRRLSRESGTPDIETVPVVTIEMEAATYDLLFPGQEPNETVVDEIIKAVEFQRNMLHTKEKYKKHQPAQATA